MWSLLCLGPFGGVCGAAAAHLDPHSRVSLSLIDTLNNLLCIPILHTVECVVVVGQKKQKKSFFSLSFLDFLFTNHLFNWTEQLRGNQEKKRR